jgi:hypothetical protein
MKSTEQIRHEAFAIFGAEKAAEAIMTLGFFLERCGVDDLESSIPFWMRVDYPELETETLTAMSRLGLHNTEAYQGHLVEWKGSIAKKIGSGAATVERLGYDPVNLGTAFHLGKLYYPVQTLVRTQSYTKEGIKRESERIDVVVLRSDRSILNIKESEDENGKTSGIIRLTDGTLLQKKPTASPYASWSWESIQRYLQRDYAGKSLMTLAARVHRHLRSRVWLPDEDDYWLLTCAVVTSYIQAIFDAVPLVLLNGGAGTGKSELGAAMTEVSCNAVMIGQSSPPTMLRLMDEARGLIVIDDLESIGVKSGAAGKEKFSEMVQLLKTSYKKTSATKIVTNTKRKTEVMNFFGVKIVSNTAGVDAILGSRMLHIGTDKIPKHDIDQFLARQGLSSEELIKLRNELHIWAFDNVEMVDSTYQDIVAGSSERDEEIAAPLRVVALLTGIPEAHEALDRALGNQSTRKNTHASPEEALKSVMDKLLREGAQQLTITEISLRLRKIMGVRVIAKRKLTWMQPEWISKKIRSMGYIDASTGRKNLFGFQMRLVSVAKEKRMELQAFGTEKRDPFEFCGGCVACPYKSQGCEILPYRVTKEGLI